MSKSHVDRNVQELSKVWECILVDAAHAFPANAMDFERDLIRCERLVRARGIRVFLLDLPALAKHLDRSLDNGQYNPSNLPLTKRAGHGVVMPKFLGSLYLLIFEPNGRLRDDADIEAVFFLRQLLLFAKKFTIDCPRSAVVAAVATMVDHDKTLPEPKQFWQDHNVLPINAGYVSFSRDLDCRKRGVSSGLSANLDVISKLVFSGMPDFCPTTHRFKHGPGAISEVSGPVNKYDWYSWPEELERCFPICDYGFHNYGSWASHAATVSTGGSLNSSPSSSRLIAVPKTYAGPRLIAAEPNSKMWCQQSLLDYLVSTCDKSWISDFVRFNDQRLNQGLATWGSVGGHLSTIDLSMASDCVTPDFVFMLFRRKPKLLEAIRAARTSVVSQQLAPGASDTIVLRKLSTMGNAYTFPIESICFLAITLAAVLTHRGQTVTLSAIRALRFSVSVFGDDIIVPSDCREAVIEALEKFHFRVNTDKSYGTGKFRESCGVDSFRGHNVTPVYYRRHYDAKPESLASVLDTSNRFYRKYLLNTSNYLASTLPRGIRQVAQGSGAFGLECRSMLSNCHIKARYNAALHRHELRCLTIKSKVTKQPTGGDYALFQYFTESPSPLTAWTNGYVRRTKQKIVWSWVGSY
ncbi:RNA-directed RNA polymerase [ssRNA phage SRR7976325_27]|uniref:RNA-directed RNA polymerase n=1 Tax=ssRNA phage SRR7976325_27 TaxID=2786715 RepID=A0A8S5L5W5_9VIRU|nr:RNA-directed RNA polymerase [ssRNA phage SRR7976325_27]DAD52746.1 TPA_asm: RNA-directed RNA polymerase [ssRNA phage SRR7976325_27]